MTALTKACMAERLCNEIGLNKQEAKSLVDLRIVSHTGCERFAEMAFDKADEIVNKLTDGRCWVQSTTVREHAHNSATVELADTQKVRFTKET